MNPGGFLIALAGLFSLCGAVMDWNWFINSRKARLFVSLFGRKGARVFYGILGLVLFIMGLGLGFGIIES